VYSREITHFGVRLDNTGVALGRLEEEENGEVRSESEDKGVLEMIGSGL